MKNIHYRVRVEKYNKNTISEAFEVITGLMSGNTLYPILFNLTLEKTFRATQKKLTGITIGVKNSDAWVCRQFKHFDSMGDDDGDIVFEKIN